MRRRTEATAAATARTVRRRTAFLALAVAAAGVVAAVAAQYRRWAAQLFTATRQPFEIRLVDQLDGAEVSAPLAEIRVDGSSAQTHQHSGWLVVPAPQGVAPSGWIAGRSASVEVTLGRVGPLAVDLDVAVKEGESGLPPEQLTLSWNGARVQTLTVGQRHVVRVPIPAEVQRCGPNRLTLAPAYWLDVPAGRSVPIAVRLFRIGFAAPGRGRDVRSAGVTRAGETIVQRADSTATFYLVLPPGARLRGEVACKRPAQCPDTALAVIDGGGAARDLVTLGAGPDGRRDIDVDLSAFAAQPVALTLRASGAAPTAPVEWRGLRVEGARTQVRDAAIAALRKPYNVLVVLFDTLRADHTEPYGSRRVRTPQLSRLAAQGVVFANARASSSLTRSSVASLFSSFYPLRHGVVGNADSLPEALPWLPVALREHGYATLSVIDNANVGSAFGFGRGFEETRDIFERYESRRLRFPDPRDLAAAVWRRHVEPFLKRAGTRPFFVYLHEIDPHGPYKPLPPYDRMYDFGYTGALASESAVIAAVNRGRIALDAADRRYLDSQYSGEVSYMDAYLGWILDHLRDSGLAANTLVVFLSDHGEELGEHGKIGHMVTVYDEVLRVPLLLALPGVLPEHRRVEAPAELVDVAPTILDLLGLPPSAAAQGRSLLPAIAVGDRADAHPTFAHIVVEGSRQRDAVRVGRWKLVRERHLRDTASSPLLSLYDTATDRGESVDLWGGAQVAGRVLLRLLEEHERESTSEGVPAAAGNPLRPQDLDPNVIENLRNLGYLQ